jgi:parallel beta-helix repeat protein
MSGRPRGKISRRTALQKGGIVAGSVLGLSSASASAAADSVEIDESTRISEPGEYVLTDDLDVEGNCFELDGSDIVLDGNGHTISGDGTGIGIIARATPVVRNLTIENFESGCSVRLFDSGITMENTVISNNAAGIDGVPKTVIDVHNSIIKDNGVGIGPEEASDITITESTLSGNRSAVSTGSGNFVQLNSSVVKDNGTGIEAGEGTFLDSTVTGNDGYGLRLIGFIGPLDLGDATIVGNEIRNNAGPGIEFTSSNGDVRENTITDNRTGIVLSGVTDSFAGSTPEYAFTGNNVEGNDEFGIRNESEQPVVASCNYWGHPTGPVHEENPFKKPKGDEIDGDVEFVPWSVRPIRDGEATCVGGRRR